MEACSAEGVYICLQANTRSKDCSMIISIFLIEGGVYRVLPKKRLLLDVILLLMDEILYMMAQNVPLMELLLNLAPKLYFENI